MQGVIDSMQGPTLLSLSRLLHSNVSEVSRGMVGAALGNLSGALLCKYPDFSTLSVSML